MLLPKKNVFLLVESTELLHSPVHFEVELERLDPGPACPRQRGPHLKLGCMEFIAEPTVQDLFVRRARRSASCSALKHDSESLTYDDLSTNVSSLSILTVKTQWSVCRNLPQQMLQLFHLCHGYVDEWNGVTVMIVFDILRVLYNLCNLL